MTPPEYSTEFAFDGPALVEWPLRHYGPTCSVCHVKFCGTRGTVCGSCTPWEEALARETTVIVEPALSPRMALTVRCFSRWAAANDAGQPIRAALWRWAGEVLDKLAR